MLENYYDDFTPGCVFRRNTWKNDTYFLKVIFKTYRTNVYKSNVHKYEHSLVILNK